MNGTGSSVCLLVSNLSHRVLRNSNSGSHVGIFPWWWNGQSERNATRRKCQSQQDQKVEMKDSMDHCSVLKAAAAALMSS